MESCQGPYLHNKLTLAISSLLNFWSNVISQNYDDKFGEKIESESRAIVEFQSLE